jgi:malonyl CoA-acyl carrier protein transacylase
MINISITIGNTLEALIMATREELMAKIAEVNQAVGDEGLQVKTAIDALNLVVTGLQEKISGLELAAGTPADFTAELQSLASLKTSVAAIYEPTVPTVPTAIATPVV